MGSLQDPSYWAAVRLRPQDRRRGAAYHHIRPLLVGWRRGEERKAIIRHEAVCSYSRCNGWRQSGFGIVWAQQGAVI